MLDKEVSGYPGPRQYWLGRGRVCLLYKKGVEIPSDLGGLGYVEMDPSGTWRMRLAREVDAVGIAVDIRKVAELS